jgi:hypothetical protein
MSSPQAQIWSVPHGADAEIVLTFTDTTNPTGWAMKFTVAATKGGTPLVEVTAITISGPDANGKYSLTTPLSRAQTGTTLTDDKYWADLWRTDSGSNRPLASGRLIMPDSVRAVA